MVSSRVATRVDLMRKILELFLQQLSVGGDDVVSSAQGYLR